ncbi:MAG: glycosyltransferase family 2 protein [Lachnospiraceae bacterium]|nr:glycosyltransferase [Robinsoniella sp.]MDY3765203.1 glycosyltransferase family 2 protein [Lachnospiraceae bacterium]
MRDKPLVSVVIPAYQCSHLIEKAIDSVLIQDVELEVLVIDDGSSDDLDQVMRQYEDDRRVRYIKNEKNMGVAATRNRGVRLAEGRYIAFLDADDWWAHGKLKHQLSAIRESDAVLCSTARELVTPEGKRTGRVISVPQKITYHMMLSHNCIACSSVLVKREVMMAVPMEHEDCHEDYLAWLKILREYGDGCGINEPLLKYRLSSAGKSGNKFHAAKMTWKVYQYMGFSAGQSMWCFIRYAFCGVGKYTKAVLGQKGKAQ